MVNDDLYVDLLFAGGMSKQDHFSLKIRTDSSKGTMTITGIKPGPHGYWQ